MTTATLDQLRHHLDLPQSPVDLQPPPRFAHCRFDTYHIDPDQSGQAKAVVQLQTFSRRKTRRFWPLAKRLRSGCYLDGAFGVGKTHLLAASWHAAQGDKRYLSFAEAISLMHVLGPRRAQQLLQADLICLDEFELDDPSNTRLIDLLLHELIQNGARVIVTSNTAPARLGQGRFASDVFRRQLQRIANHFHTITVPGQDYRKRQPPTTAELRWGPRIEAPAAQEHHLVLSALELDRLLLAIPVINLRRLAHQLTALTILDLTPCQNQFAALRLVHLVDRLYDYQVQLHVRTAIAMDDLFLPDYRNWAFAAKYSRCLSRLHQLCRHEVLP
jgi:cell division protein ZapE